MKKVFLIYFILIVSLTSSNIYCDWADRFASAKQVSLNEILEKPEAWLNVPVRIPVRFAWYSDIYVPYRTRFTPDIFMNFAAWDVQTPIWFQDGFEKPHPFFYVEKDNPELLSFLKLTMFQTVCMLGKVEGIFAGKPFIRVVWFCKLPGTLNFINLKMLYNAFKFYKERKFDQAIPLLHQIFITHPPDDIKVMMHKAIALVHMHESKSYGLALQELNKAKMLSPNDSELQTLLEECHLYISNQSKVLKSRKELEAGKESEKAKPIQTEPVKDTSTKVILEPDTTPPKQVPPKQIQATTEPEKEPVPPAKSVPKSDESKKQPDPVPTKTEIEVLPPEENIPAGEPPSK